MARLMLNGDKDQPSYFDKSMRVIFLPYGYLNNRFVFDGFERMIL